MTLGEKYRAMKHFLQYCSSSPALDAQMILTHVTSLNKSQLIAYPERILNDNELKQIDRLVNLRRAKKPMAYLMGHQPFWTLDLIVTPDTLIPRSETECLVEWIIKNCTGQVLKIADLGTGCGSIALALAVEKPKWTIHATDLSEKALDIAKENAKKYALNTVNFFQGSWFDALPNNDYDIIVSNPPYIAPNDPHLRELEAEPRTALVAENKGLKDIFYLIEQSQRYLKREGVLIIEHGYDQQTEILNYATQWGYRPEGFRDLSNNDRFVVLHI